MTNQGGKMAENEDSTIVRIATVCQLEEIAEAVEHLDQLPTQEAIDTITFILKDCKDVVTNLRQLRGWLEITKDGIITEGCPTDEEMQLAQDVADQEQLERDARYIACGNKDGSYWNEGRGYGDFPDAPVDGMTQGVDYD